MHQPGLGFARDISPARRRILKIIQSEGDIGTHLDDFRGEWRAESVVHGDIRSANVLVQAEEATPSPRVQLVDFESVQWGDPACDLGGALHEFVLLWVRGLPMDNDLEAVERAAHSEHSLESLAPAVHELWRGYCAAAGVERGREEELARRAVRFAAARLLQSIFESAGGSDELTVAEVMQLQIAANILADPDAALVLFGLSGATLSS